MKTVRLFTTLVMVVLCLCSCNSFKHKNYEITYNGNIITITIPMPQIGVAGFGEVTYDGFALDDIDREIFDKLRKDDSDGTYYINLVVKFKDSYGNYSDSKTSNLGTLDASEVKKYASYGYFKGKISSLISNAVLNRPSVELNTNAQDSTTINNENISNPSNNQTNTPTEQYKNDEQERIAGELRWTNPVYIKNRMGEIIYEKLGQESFDTGAQFNYICQESEEFYKLFERYKELTGESPY